MSTFNGDILTVNGGSSSIKFALFRFDGREIPLRRIQVGAIDRIGHADAVLWTEGLSSTEGHSRLVKAKDFASAVGILMDWFGEHGLQDSLVAIAHRIVHGGPKYYEPQRITDDVIAELRKVISLDPEHLPVEILLVEEFRRRFLDLPQFACFDTSFHHELPRVAQILPIPRRFESHGVRRYGFHGLSYAFLMEELERLGGKDVSCGRVILAHLGSGASLAAVSGRRPIDTSMCFTPNSGIPMGTRSGDLDPGLVRYLSQIEGLNGKQFDDLANFHSGLMGISETSSDMRDLLERESQDIRAAEAVALFCYQVKKWIGAFAAALGGLNTLVFSGGIGENAPKVRSMICADLDFLGIELDENQNAANQGVISKETGRVAIRMIRTDEERMMAQLVCGMLGEATIKQITKHEILKPSHKSEGRLIC